MTKKKSAHRGSSLPDNLADSKVHQHFKLGRVLTRDATGTLYSAASTYKGREVAINVLASKCKVISKKLIKIQHPNICKAYKVLKLKDGSVVIVIEKPEGRPIMEFIESEQGAEFTTSQTLSAILQLLSALHAIHQTKKIARNLSINTIFLFRDENDNLRLKLVSCGIGGGGVNLKAPHYLSPERIMNVDKGDPRSDIWAAGAILYHLVFGHPPFKGNAYEIAQKNLLEDPDFDPGKRVVPDDLMAVIRRALDRDETQRYQNVTQMVGDLLPLRELYNEPMSDEVSVALRKSYPPPGFMTSKDKAVTSAPIIESAREPRVDLTMEYGAKKPAAQKPRGEETVAGKPVAPSKKARKTLLFEASPKKIPAEEVAISTTQKQRFPKKTLLGMPAMDTGNRSPDHRAESKEPKRSPSMQKKGAGKRAKPSDSRDGFFSPRSILGSEDEIKELESELDFLDPADDGEIPTLVVNSDTFSAYADKINELSELSEETDPSSKPTLKPPHAPEEESKAKVESKRGAGSEGISKGRAKEKVKKGALGSPLGKTPFGAKHGAVKEDRKVASKTGGRLQKKIGTKLKERSERPAKDRPERLGKDRPERLGKDRPERLGKDRPERLGDRPERLGKDRPERLGKDRPERLGKDRPERLGKDRPERLGKDRPKRLGKERPERQLRDRPGRLGKDRPEPRPKERLEVDFKEKPKDVPKRQKNLPEALYDPFAAASSSGQDVEGQVFERITQPEVLERGPSKGEASVADEPKERAGRPSGKNTTELLQTEIEQAILETRSVEEITEDISQIEIIGSSTAAEALPHVPLTSLPRPGLVQKLKRPPVLIGLGAALVAVIVLLVVLLSSSDSDPTQKSPFHLDEPDKIADRKASSETPVEPEAKAPPVKAASAGPSKSPDGDAVKGTAEGAPAEDTPEEAPAEGAPAEGAPAEGAPIEGAPAEVAPAEGAPAEGAAEEEPPPSEIAEKGSAGAAEPAVPVVTVDLIGLPKKSRIKVNGRLSRIPIEHPESKSPVTVTITADGYKPYKTKIVMDADKEVAIKMERRKAPKKVVHKNKPKGKPEKGGVLVSNPFKN